MINIHSKTLESLEFPLVLQQVASACITVLGEEKVLAIVPFSKICLLYTSPSPRD